MAERRFVILYRFRYPLCGLVVIAALLILSLFLSVINNSQAQAKTSAPDSSASLSAKNEPNIITGGFDSALNVASGATSGALSSVQGINRGVKTASMAVVSATYGGGRFAAENAYGAALAAVHGVGKSIGFAAHAPVYAWHGISSVAHIGSFIKPSETEAKIPQIDPTIAQEIASSKSAAITYSAAAQEDLTTQWPIKGVITEEFGVPHWPYQPIHTGIDISDSAAPGVTPIRPFKPGRVIVVIHSNAGFGNHVIIDHGGGLTSLYGHMYSTAVQVGQLVDKNTVLGYEGSTGVSTGVHVHFEIEVNNRPVNPHLYVAGSPS